MVKTTPARSRITMQTIARRAGVSRTTVSLVVNGRGEELKINPQTRARVLKAVQELNYQPDISARALQGQRTQTIGVLWSLTGYNPITEMVNRLALMAKRHGYASFLADHFNDVEETRRVLNDFRQRRVDSIVIDADKQLLTDASIVQSLLSFDAAVAISPEPVDVPVDLIVHRRGPLYAEAAQYLLEAGRRRLAIAMPEIANHEPKIEAVREVMRAGGWDPNDLLTLRFTANYPAVDQATGRHQLEEMLQRRFPNEVPFDALLCVSDEDAATALRWLTDRGLDVPKDVALVGANDTVMAQLLRPPLASGRRHNELLANRIEEMLFLRLSDPDRPLQRVEVNMEFVWRESAGGPASGRQPNVSAASSVESGEIAARGGKTSHVQNKRNRSRNGS